MTGDNWWVEHWPELTVLVGFIASWADSRAKLTALLDKTTEANHRTSKLELDLAELKGRLHVPITRSALDPGEE